MPPESTCGAAPRPRVAVVVLGYKNRPDLELLFRSLEDLAYTPASIFFVDNDSRDGSPEFIEEKHPAVIVLRNGANLGYAGAYNRALDRVFHEGFDAAVLLNPDTIVHPDAVTHLVESAYREPGIACAQATLLLLEGDVRTDRLNTSSNAIHYLGFGYCRDFGKRAADMLPGSDFEAPYPSGACFLVKRDAWERIGGLEASFFAYVEDQDLGFRLRSIGEKTIVSVGARVWHAYRFEKTDRNHRKFFLLERNRLLFMARNYPARWFALFAPAFLFFETGVLAHACASGFGRDKLAAYLDVLNRRNEIWRERKRIQEHRTASTSVLASLLVPKVQFEAIDSPLLRAANVIIGAWFGLVKSLL